MDETIRGQGLPSPREVNLIDLHTSSAHHTCMNTALIDVMFVLVDEQEHLGFLSLFRAFWFVFLSGMYGIMNKGILKSIND